MTKKCLQVLCVLMLAVTAMAERKNIILIMADDSAADNYGCYGSTYFSTPRLDALANGNQFGDSVARGLAFLKRHHRIDGSERPHDGGMAGSTPIWGGYARFEYPNWAAKFFADGLMADMEQNERESMS